MSLVAELFGHRAGDDSPEAAAHLSAAHCPHRQDACDGGGNRDMAKLLLRDDAGLRARFDPEVIKRGEVACGICSIGAAADSWIVCPRRLFSISEAGICPANPLLGSMIRSLLRFETGSQAAVWKELKVSETDHDMEAKFNFSFDYVLRQRRNGGVLGPPAIIEVMACSTSGGNRGLGTDIATAFRKVVLAPAAQRSSITAPGVNVRQVWARMASQLIPKAEAAMAWGGTTIWVIQDKLAAYIKQTTGLRLEKLRSNTLHEVNIISASANPEAPPVLYSGPISSGGTGQPCFLDILRPSMVPTLKKFDSLCEKEPGFHLTM